ncbi:jg6576 [Pararge aegeria aegeria]|uniref:Jg6576 protein n=1 Tax=Pararge aegeria aegeria TaxID=348720 RepID=A0A8S4R7B0_9NEOP|nr:jg6576 [Pararge aegeria aegeria]
MKQCVRQRAAANGSGNPRLVHFLFPAGRRTRSRACPTVPERARSDLAPLNTTCNGATAMGLDYETCDYAKFKQILTKDSLT